MSTKTQRKNKVKTRTEMIAITLDILPDRQRWTDDFTRDADFAFKRLQEKYDLSLTGTYTLCDSLGFPRRRRAASTPDTGTKKDPLADRVAFLEKKVTALVTSNESMYRWMLNLSKSLDITQPE